MLTNESLEVDVSATVSITYNGKTLALTASSAASTDDFTLTFNAASGYPADFSVMLVNEHAERVMKIVISGSSTIPLFPGQSIIVFNQDDSWNVFGETRWVLPSGDVNVYADYTNGVDDIDRGSIDRPFRSVAYAAYHAVKHYDFSGGLATQSRLTINMAEGTNDQDVFHFAPHSIVGGQGGATIRILGASGAGSQMTNSSGSPIEVYFGAIIQFERVRLAAGSGSCISANWGSKVYINDGVQLLLGYNGHGISVLDGAHVELGGNLSVSGDFSGSVIYAGTGGTFNSQSYNITIDSNSSWGGGFVTATECGVVKFTGGSTITNTGSFTTAGPLYTASLNGVIISNTGSPNTYFPGNLSGTSATGSQVV
jgi:hypothetical protein